LVSKEKYSSQKPQEQNKANELNNNNNTERPKNNIKRACQSIDGLKIKKSKQKNSQNKVSNSKIETKNDQSKKVQEPPFKNHLYTQSQTMLCNLKKSNSKKNISSEDNINDISIKTEFNKKKISKFNTKKESFNSKNKIKNNKKDNNEEFKEKEKEKEKNHEEKKIPKLSNTKSSSFFNLNKSKNKQSKNNLYDDINKNEFKTARKKTPFRMSPHKEKNNKKDILIGVSSPKSKKPSNNLINYNKNIDDSNSNNNTHDTIKKSGTFRKNFTSAQCSKKNINKDKNLNLKQSPNILNQKYINSNKNEFKIKSNEIIKNENKALWGWGRNTSKNVDAPKKINYTITEAKPIGSEPNKNSNLNASKSQKKIKR